MLILSRDLVVAVFIAGVVCTEFTTIGVAVDVYNKISFQDGKKKKNDLIQLCETIKKRSMKTNANQINQSIEKKKSKKNNQCRI